jgi:hypothetical protein
MNGEIEIARFFHESPAEACGKLLADAGIPFRLSTDALTSDLTALCRASNPAILVMVPRGRTVEARHVLLNHARSEVAHGVDASHPMMAWGDADLASVLKEASAWSAFDLAVAEKLLEERGVTVDPGNSSPARRLEGAPSPDITKQEPLPGDEPANPWVVGFGFLMAPLGAAGILLFCVPGTLLAMIIACDSMFSTKLDAEGRRQYVHTPRSRTVGLVLFFVSLVIFCVATGIRLTAKFSQE